jgi:hypothetical protein
VSPQGCDSNDAARNLFGGESECGKSAAPFAAISPQVLDRISGLQDFKVRKGEAPDCPLPV